MNDSIMILTSARLSTSQDYDTVLSGFKDGDELRPILQPIIAELKSNPTIENHLRYASYSEFSAFSPYHDSN